MPNGRLIGILELEITRLNMMLIKLLLIITGAPLKQRVNQRERDSLMLPSIQRRRPRLILQLLTTRLLLLTEKSQP